MRIGSMEVSPQWYPNGWMVYKWKNHGKIDDFAD
jgi:hypothetical protein